MRGDSFVFSDRSEAGRKLGNRLSLMPLINPIVIALPRGGVPIGFEVAKILSAPLEVLVVRKVGSPSNPEFGIGAITEEGSYWIDAEAAQGVGASFTDIENTLEAENAEVNRRIAQYRGSRPLPSLQGRSVILVDDGLATGVTARVGAHYLLEKGAGKVILALPTCSPDAAAALRLEIGGVICLEEPDFFYSVGQFYERFGQITDEEVLSLLAKAKEFTRFPNLSTASNELERRSEEVLVRGQGVELNGTLTIPESAQGIILFAHGSGSSRLSPRNRQVAASLNRAGLGTLLFDLLTGEESENSGNVFDIPLLASRLEMATRWLKRQSAARNLPLGYFGASTGGGAALWAAAELGNEVSAVVSRGGRPDLAIRKISATEVNAPTLLIVGGDDKTVIEMNREAMKYLLASNLVVIPGATHLFEEPGALEAVSRHAAAWFKKYLAKGIRQVAA